MAGFRGRSPSPSGGESRSRRATGFVRRCERCCTATLRCFPLALVYGLTTWAIYTQVRTCLLIGNVEGSAWKGNTLLGLSLALYALLNCCYTVAVFTDPGSPLNPASSSTSSRHAYSHLPTVEPRATAHDGASTSAGSTITVKSTGGMRFCKKCQTKKPDRAHHCSTCGRCVLKMDHHCPWLATCVGLRNYKPFLLFCSYVTLFCWLCFWTSAGFVWGEIVTTDMSQRGDLFNVNVIILAVIAGVFGLVLAGFTGWHLSLAVRNQTTIECLEKTRYLRPIRRTMDRATHAFPPPQGHSAPGDRSAADLVQHYGHQLAELHANAIPGVTRAEEGEERASPAPGDGGWDADGREGYYDAEASAPLTASEALRSNYAANERARERARYDEYLEEEESSKLPHAFDLGWRRNLRDLFGSDWRLWLLPVCNTAGDGWHWEPSARWAAAQRDLQRERETRARQQEEREVAAGWGQPGSYGRQRYQPREVQMDDLGNDTASTDGLYERDDEQPRGSREWRDWE